MKAKRLWSCLLLCMLALGCVLSFPATGLAEDSLHTQVTVSKSSLPGPGTVGLKITITNNGDPVSNVTLTYPDSGQTISLGNIATDATEVHENARWEITESMLGTPLRFEVGWTSQDGSTHTGLTPAVTIEQSSSTLSVQAEATVTSTHVQEGDKVTFTFTFHNEGDVDVTDAYLVAEPLNGGDRLGDDFELAPGETNTKTWSPTINEEITVRPVYTYTVDGEEHELSCDPITVRVGDAVPEAGALALEVTPNATTVGPGGEVEFSIGVANTGTAEVANVRVTCSNGQSAQLPQESLAAGASASATQTIAVDSSQTFTFTATGTSNGEPLTAESQPIQITVDPTMATPTPAPTLDAASVVEIDVSVVTRVQQPTSIPVEITVRNLSEEPLSNIVVSAEVSGGTGAAAASADSPTPLPLESVAGAAAPQIITLGTLDTLAPGENNVINGTLDVQQTASYIFRVSAEMPDGTLITSETGSAEITVEGGGNLLGLTNFQWILIIAGAAAVVAIIIIVVHLRGKKAKAAEQQPQRTRADRPDRQPTASRTTTSRSATPRTDTSRQPTPGHTSTSSNTAAARYRDAQDTSSHTVVGSKPASARQIAPRKASSRGKNAAASSRYGDRNRF